MKNFILGIVTALIFSWTVLFLLSINNRVTNIEKYLIHLQQVQGAQQPHVVAVDKKEGEHAH